MRCRSGYLHGPRSFTFEEIGMKSSPTASPFLPVPLSLPIHPIPPIHNASTFFRRSREQRSRHPIRPTDRSLIFEPRRNVNPVHAAPASPFGGGREGGREAQSEFVIDLTDDILVPLL